MYQKFHYYIIFTSLLRIITVIMSSLLPIIIFIITYYYIFITSLLPIVTIPLLPTITVIMNS